ncbi:hypothetical protein AAFC00_001827 [Neodothiora populina]|uniref:Histidine kinase n=1 Tax=Neodothiora populina TaxID=2781224 RepID=A0ABR3PQA9_9PEZI
MALAALQYLPMPLLVLSSEKAIVLANEAMGRLLGVDLQMPYLDTGSSHAAASTARRNSQDFLTATDIFRGVTMASLGVDLLQNASPVWIPWDNFLESVKEDAMSAFEADQTASDGGDVTPTADDHSGARSPPRSIPLTRANLARTTVHDVAVDVVFSTNRHPHTGLPKFTKSESNKSGSEKDIASHIQSTVIISVWTIDDSQFYTLTFTSATDTRSSVSRTSHRNVARTQTTHHATSYGSGSSSSSSSRRAHHSNKGSASASPSVNPPPSLPNGPPVLTATAATEPSLFSKSNRLKDALLNSLNDPAFAMWKDESFGIPNRAAIRLILPDEEEAFHSVQDQRDFLARYILWKGDFSSQLEMEEYPIMHLMSRRMAFKNRRVGMYHPKTGAQMLFDVDGEPILDDDTGEFLGGFVIFHDVTVYANTIIAQQVQNERQFESITNMIPQMIWTTTPEGQHDYYSQRWYEYTGLTVEQSLGQGWRNPFHPDDMKLTAQRYERWHHSLKTGEEYRTEYRCLSKDGEWRWMLGGALPMRDDEGTIVKWFGTCTDIHEQVLAREIAKQTRSQLLRVVEMAKITLWTVDQQHRLSMLEGSLLGKRSPDRNDDEVRAELIGRDIYDLLKDHQLPDGRDYEYYIEGILSGTLKDETVEIHQDDTNRWFRTRFIPLHRQERNGGVEGNLFVDGVVAVSMEVTELRKREEQLRERDRENGRLLAQSEAAKEASKMKSQFLANMSHEIRTPIAGVIGMAELLLDDSEQPLSVDQRECAENLQRSANGLLTVINDILDFSKVESGRLDIEEVQFDLNVVVRDVNKMLSFAAERKGLTYLDETHELERLKVMGDPGRLRQILTNLLTNSIKFTSEGSVQMGVKIREETTDTVTVEFMIQDTGIGIEEEVRKRLFQPFSQADSSTARRFGGTGLGLTICKNLVELMHGEISLLSSLGVGTRATFWIPFNKAPYNSGDSALIDMGPIPDRLQSDLSVSDYSASPRPNSPGRLGYTQTPSESRYGSSPNLEKVNELSAEERHKTHVLVVEDNPINQQIALKTIKKLGFSVNAVWNGQEALDYLVKPESSTHPKPDVILMDVQMPIMDGYKATHTIRHLAPYASNREIQNTPIVAMTASAIQGDREKCESAGMNDYLAKPVKGKILDKMLVKWANTRRRGLISTASGKGTQTAQPAFSQQVKAPALTAGKPASPEKLQSRLSQLDFANNSALARSNETPDSQAMQHLHNVEKAIQLRDEQLIACAADPKDLVSWTADDDEHNPQSSDQKLTRENVERLTVDEHDEAPIQGHRVDEDTSSLAATMGESGTIRPHSADIAPGKHLFGK